MISLYDVLDAANGQLFGEPGAQLFSGFCFDSRFAEEASLYAALKTDQGDGHQYIEEAVRNGATGILCTRPPEIDTDGLSVILVKDPQTALMKWAYFILNKLGTQVIAVTGSSGKSVTIDAVAQALRTRYTVRQGMTGVKGRLNLPLSLAQITPQDHFIVMELSATEPGEMSEMMLAVQPQVGVVTQIGFSYADRFETTEQLMQETSLMIEYLSATGLAVLNYNDDRAREMIPNTRARTITMGIDGFGADFTAYNLVFGLTGTGFDVRYGSQRFVGRWTPLLGRQHLYAILAALAIGQHYEVPLDEALKALTDMHPLSGRMNPLNGRNDTLLIDDSYDADPQSTVGALDWLRDVTDKQHRTIFVFGDMDNLGGHSARAHRLIGQRAADFVDHFITMGTDAALAGRGALDHGMDKRRVQITYNIQDAVSQLQHLDLNENDIVLIKGSPSARMELLVGALLANDADRAQLPRRVQADDAALIMRPTSPSWVEIDLEALANNVSAFKHLIGESVALFAVVKANAYGHGAISAARTALLNGADHLAVSSMEEALELRDAGIEAPILVMSYTPITTVRQAVRQNIVVTVYDLDLVRAYDRAAREAGGRLRVHVKIDTGMGRLGVLTGGAVPFFRHLLGLTHLEVEGIYTHLASADDDLDYANEQLSRFRQVLTPLRAAGFNFKYIHAANTAATLRLPAAHFNAVRVGLGLYGLTPSDLARLPDGCKPALAWKSVIAQVKMLPPNHPVGYGMTYRTSDAERIAIIPVGYADGLRRAPGYWGHVLVNGQVAPIIGRVSMEKTVISVQHIPSASVGDEVVLIGRQGDVAISAEDIARRIGTISYEILTGVLPRVPRG